VNKNVKQRRAAKKITRKKVKMPSTKKNEHKTYKKSRVSTITGNQYLNVDDS